MARDLYEIIGRTVVFIVALIALMTLFDIAAGKQTTSIEALFAMFAVFDGVIR